MIHKQLKAYRKYQQFLQNLLILCGCWYMPTKSGKSIYYWSIYVFVAMILYTMMSLHMCYILRHNLKVMMKFVGITITGLGAVLKVVTFMINRDSLINYHRTLNNLFEEELMKNEKIQTIIFSSLRTIYTLAYTYFAILVVVIFAFFGSTYIFIIHNLLYLHLTTNYTLPLSRGIGWFWPIPHNFLYHLHLFYETSLIILSTMTACGVDSAFGFYVYQFSSTIRAMTFALTNPLSTEKFSDILRTCVVKHQKLLQCRNTLEHIYGPIIFWHIVTNAVLLCSLMYDLISLPDYNFYNVSASLVYAVIKLLQTFIYAWHGTVLTSAGEDFRRGIYFGKWPNSSLDHHVRTNVILIMMQKPMTINAVFSAVDVIMFTNSVNATMSYFFLLQSIE
ncbi:OR49A protein, partial [Acromyrmex insinuator]